MPQVCLQFVIVVFPDHTHLLFWTQIRPIQTARKGYQLMTLLLIELIDQDKIFLTEIKRQLFTFCDTNIKCLVMSQSPFRE